MDENEKRMKRWMKMKKRTVRWIKMKKDDKMDKNEKG